MRMSGIQSGDLLIMSMMLFTDVSPGHSIMTSSWTCPTHPVCEGEPGQLIEADGVVCEGALPPCR